MTLDMQGAGPYTSEPHWRQYLGLGDKLHLIEAQDFDYSDYDSSRFLSLTLFVSKAEAAVTPIDLVELIVRAETREDAAQALRNIRAVFRSGTVEW